MYKIININIFIIIISGIIYLFIINKCEKLKINITIINHIILFLFIHRTTLILSCFTYELLLNYSLFFEVEPLFMVDKVNNSNSDPLPTNTNRSIVMSNGTWSSTVRSIFIYSTAAFQLHLSKAPGTGFRKVGIAATAMAVDYSGKIIENAINDPSYVRDHVRNWIMTWENNSEGNSGSVKIDIGGDTSLQESLKSEITKNSNSFIPSSNGINSDISSFIDGIVQPIIKLLAPQTVNYSVDLLMDQHHFIAICLFIIVLSLLILFLILLYNMLLILYKDKILTFFKNKYILFYLNLQYKIIYLETIVIIILILNIIYYLLIGTHFLAIFPIDATINK